MIAWVVGRRRGRQAQRQRDRSRAPLRTGQADPRHRRNQRRTLRRNQHRLVARLKNPRLPLRLRRQVPIRLLFSSARQQNRTPPPDPSSRNPRSASLLARRQADRLPLRRGSHPPRQPARRRETARRSHRRRRPRNQARRRPADLSQRTSSARSPPPASTPTNSTGRPIPMNSPISPPRLREKTTGGSPSSTPSPSSSDKPTSSSTPPTPRPAPRPADRRSPLVARRQADRLHRRINVRSRRDGRRHLPDFLKRRPSDGYLPCARGIASLVLLGE